MWPAPLPYPKPENRKPLSTAEKRAAAAAAATECKPAKAMAPLPAAAQLSLQSCMHEDRVWRTISIDIAPKKTAEELAAEAAEAERLKELEASRAERLKLLAEASTAIAAELKAFSAARVQRVTPSAVLTQLEHCYGETKGLELSVAHRDISGQHISDSEWLACRDAKSSALYGEILPDGVTMGTTCVRATASLSTSLSPAPSLRVTVSLLSSRLVRVRSDECQVFGHRERLVPARTRYAFSLDARRASCTLRLAAVPVLALCALCPVMHRAQCPHTDSIVSVRCAAVAAHAGMGLGKLALQCFLQYPSLTRVSGVEIIPSRVAKVGWSLLPPHRSALGRCARVRVQHSTRCCSSRA